MAVLNGSTSANFSAVANDSRESPNSSSKITYLTAQRRSCTAQGNSYCLIFNLRAISLISSCKAPKGHSQPQNTPRPHNKILTAVKLQSTNNTGSIKKVSQRKSVITE